MKKIYRLIRGFTRQMNRLNVNAYASSAAFFIFLSLIPVIILVCSLLPFTPLEKSDLLTAVSIMPSQVVPLMVALIESVYDSTVGVVSVAAIVTAWSAGKGMLALMRGLNAVNGVIEDRGYIMQRITATFYTIIMLVLLLLSLIIMVFGNTIVRLAAELFPLLKELFQILLLFKPLFSWCFLTFSFMLIYAFVPNCRLRVRNQFPGALFSAVTWNLFSKGLSIYIENFNGLSIYGSLSAIVVFMLWIYFCMYLFLAGAHLNRFAAPFAREIMMK